MPSVGVKSPLLRSCVMGKENQGVPRTGMPPRWSTAPVPVPCWAYSSKLTSFIVIHQLSSPLGQVVRSTSVSSVMSSVLSRMQPASALKRLGAYSYSAFWASPVSLSS